MPIADSDHRFHPAMTGLDRAGQLWADPDIDQAARWTRHLLERPAERRRLGDAARHTILSEFSRAAVGTRMKAHQLQVAAVLGRTASAAAG